MDEIPEESRRWLERVATPLALYHRYAINGLDKLPSQGPALVVFSHSFATYDSMLFCFEAFRQRQIVIRALGDDLIFKIPIVGGFAKNMGVVPANPEDAASLLNEGQILAVAPGGMREALKPSKNKYQVLWQKRKGFVRLAIKAQCPIYLAACPRADDIFSVYDNQITKFIYKNFKLPLPLVRGFGLSLIPRPIKLTHYVSDPLMPPAFDKQHFNLQVNQFHHQIKGAMKQMMQAGGS